MAAVLIPVKECDSTTHRMSIVELSMFTVSVVQDYCFSLTWLCCLHCSSECAQSCGYHHAQRLDGLLPGGEGVNAAQSNYPKGVVPAHNTYTNNVDSGSAQLSHRNYFIRVNVTRRSFTGQGAHQYASNSIH
eukprot:scpid97167/ scgid1922/ 